MPTPVAHTRHIRYTQRLALVDLIATMKAKGMRVPVGEQPTGPSQSGPVRLSVEGHQVLVEWFERPANAVLDADDAVSRQAQECSC